MKQFVLCTAIVLAFSLSSYGVETIPANDPDIQLYGEDRF